jgi:BirA family biotin operon repressor/biotin-[acetyl-CoA-carboxylase] ligase
MMVVEPFRWNLFSFGKVESTQQLALEQARLPNAEGMVITAEEQTAGRGSRGRTWVAPPGAAVLASLILQPPPARRQPVLLTALAAVSVCEVIHLTTGLVPALKWPNDVLVSRKKVAGVLVDLTAHAAVLGVGVNVNTPTSFFASARLTEATSLAIETGRDLDREQVLSGFLRLLGDHYQRLRHGDNQTLLQQWRRYTGLRGRQAALVTARQELCGQILALDFEELLIRDDDGRELRLQPEEILQIKPLP